MRYNCHLMRGLVAAGFVACVSTHAPTVLINSTTLYGSSTSTVSDNGKQVAQYLGIPYAPQPIRFSPATPFILKDTTFQATSYGPICIQEFVQPTTAVAKAIFNIGSPSESEDCLSLNVWTPSNQNTSSPLPVLFWIYGGAFQFGGTNITTYNGTNLASHDTVVVTVNYRTNVFGFPSGTQIPINETNLGLLDQRLALKWVHQNIAAFGGDKNRITLFGESAGAFSVDSFILQGPARNPPFQSAILESGTLLVPNRAAERGPLFNALAAGCGCDQGNGTAAQLACLRAVPALKIKAVEEQLALPFNYITDNVTIFADPFARRMSGFVAKVPIMLGTNRDEGTVFTFGQTDFSQFVKTRYAGAPLSTLQGLYPVPSKYATDSLAISATFGDVVFTCPASITAYLSAKYVAPTYRYFLDTYFENTQIFPGARAYHTSEIPLVFGTYPQANATSAEVALSTYMQNVWTGFARNPRRGPWPKVGSFKEDLAIIGLNGSSGITMQSRKTVDTACDAFWDYVVAPGKDLSELRTMG